jgi:hypothetical protein
MKRDVYENGVGSHVTIDIREGDWELIELAMQSEKSWELHWMDQEDDEHIHLPHVTRKRYQVLAVESHGWSYEVRISTTWIATFDKPAQALGYVESITT